MAEQITIEIDTDGSVRVEGHDIAGPECTKLTAAIESALGETVRQTKKPEFYRAAVRTRTRTA